MTAIPHIGEVLATEFLEPFGLSQNSLAQAIGVPQNRISEIVSGNRGVSADTDLRLCRYFGLTDGYFIGIQSDLERIRTKKAIAKELAHIIPHSNNNRPSENFQRRI